MINNLIKYQLVLSTSCITKFGAKTSKKPIKNRLQKIENV